MVLYSIVFRIIHPLIQTTFVEYTLYARHCSKCWKKPQ